LSMKPDHKYYDITELIQRWSEHGVTEKDLLKYGADGKLQFSISIGPCTQEDHIEVTQCFDEKTVVTTSDFSRKIAEDFGLSVDKNEKKVVSRCCKIKTVSFENYELFDVTPLTIHKLLAKENNEVVVLLTPDCYDCNRRTSTCDNVRVTARYVLINDPNDLQSIRHPDDFLIRCSRSRLVVKPAEFLRFDEVLNSAKHSTTGQGSEPVKETNQPDPEAERKEKEKRIEDLVKVATTFCQDEMKKNVQAPTKNGIQEYLEKYVDQESIKVGKQSALPDLIFREIFKLIPSELKRKIAEKTKK
jgi:hypothetical protein